MPMVKVLLVPYTKSMIADYMDYWIHAFKESFTRAGVPVSVDVWSEYLHPPMECFVWDRIQYYSPCILEWLHGILGSRLQGYLVVGLGYLDAYSDGLNFVFGEAALGLGVASVYTKRLSPAFYGEEMDWNKYAERVAKEIIHETGHLLGLGHCPDKECVMSFSNSVWDVDGKTRFFCRECSRKLRILLNI